MSNVQTNKIIAAFMGHELIKANKRNWVYESHYKRYHFPVVYIKNWNDDYERAAEIVPRQLAYHKDWNWLMTVVDKIDSLPLFEVRMFPDYCVITDGGDQYHKETDFGGDRMNSTYTAIVDFIEYYNSK